VTRRAPHARDYPDSDVDPLSPASHSALMRQLSAAIEHGDDEHAELALSLLAEAEA
jgi:hypothetical protein